MSLGIAWLIARMMIWATSSVERKENVQFALTIGAIIGAIGLARMLKVSPVLALLSSRIVPRPGFPSLLFHDRVGCWLFAFLAVCIVGGLGSQLDACKNQANQENNECSPWATL